MAEEDRKSTNPSTDDRETVVFPAGRDLSAGTVLNDRYFLIRQLNRGGFGTVYLAHDRQMHDRPVVVKIQTDQRVDDPWFDRKFSEEVKALSLIDHPGVVVAIDSGRTADGRPFLVMQYVDGVTLRAVMSKEGMPLDRAGRILQQMGHALAAAHSAGILHRDLKPENLMLQTTPDGTERVRLIDFGIASVADIENQYQTTTRVSGTVTYMAPEQLAGQPSAMSDIYAMGLVAYEMVTGRRPFLADNAVQLANLQRAGVRVKPSGLRPGLSTSADRLILKSLEYEPAKRPANARALGDDLYEALLVGGAAVTRKRVPATRPAKRRSILIAALAGILLVLGAAGYIGFRRHPEPNRPEPNRLKQGTTPPIQAGVAKDAGATDSAVELAFWNSVKGSTEPQFYREYLAKYPNGRFASLAKLKLEMLARKTAEKAVDTASTRAASPSHADPETDLWKAVRDSEDPEAIGDYLEEYPGGRYAAAAREMLHSRHAASRAPAPRGSRNAAIPGVPDLSSLQNFNPSVSEELDAWNSLKGAKTAQPYRDYLAKYPNGMFAPVARMKIAQLEQQASQ